MRVQVEGLGTSVRWQPEVQGLGVGLECFGFRGLSLGFRAQGTVWGSGAEPLSRPVAGRSLIQDLGFRVTHTRL